MLRLVATASATVSAAAVFTPTAATAATAAGSLFARLGDIDREGATVQLGAVEGGDSFLRLFVRTHGYKSKTAGAIGHAIHHQVGFRNRTVRGERVLQVVFSSVGGKVSDKQLITHVMLYCPTNRDFLQTVPEHRV